MSKNTSRIDASARIELVLTVTEAGWLRDALDQVPSTHRLGTWASMFAAGLDYKITKLEVRS